VTHDIYHCPVCELRFRNASEMEAHIRLDHPDFNVERSEIDEHLARTRRHRRDNPPGRQPDDD
jgi:hypothetical protein